MEHGGGPFNRIQLYQCGYCVNHLAHILKGEKDKILHFPALVALFEHNTYGRILFDTGYTRRIYENGWISFVYNLLNKTYVEERNTIQYRLEQEGITRIDAVILSHAHPDHIGGLKDFHGYELIATKDTIEQMQHSRLRNLVFRNQVPEISDIRVRNVVSMKQAHFLKDYFSEVYDILGDGSILGVRLDGHCCGQMGIYMESIRLFLAADSSWGWRFAERVTRMRAIPRKIQNDFSVYQETIERIQNLRQEHPEIRILFSHESFEEGRYEGEAGNCKTLSAL